MVIPPAREARAVASVLARGGFASVVCQDLAGCSRRIPEGAGAVLLTEAALESMQATDLVAVLDKQPPWSDLPVLILVDRRHGIRKSPTAPELLNGSVTLLERPFRAATLLSSLRMALRARRRQYQVRDLLAAQRESEERFRTLAAATFEGIAITESGRVVDANEQLLRLLGYAYSELVGMEVAALIGCDDRSRVLNNIVAGRESLIEHVMIRKDGSPVIVEAHGKTVELGARSVRFTAVRDITERRRSEEALRESEERFRNYAESTEEVMWIADLRQQQLEYVSPAYERIWGRSRRAVSPKEWVESVHPEDRANVAAAVGQVSAGGRPDIEYRIIRPDGSVRWIADHAFPIFDAQGGIRRIAGVARDITGRKRAEAALQRQNQRLALLNEAAGHLLSAGETRVLSGLYERIARYFGADAYAEFRVNEKGDGLELESCWGFNESTRCSIDRLEFGQGVCGTVAQTQCPILVEHVQQSDSPMVQLIKAAGIRAYACNPLLVRGRLLGTLAFASRRRDSFEPEDLEFFETLASYVALAKDRAGLTEELRQYAGNLERKVEQRTARLQETVAELEQMSYSLIHDMRAPLRAMTSFAQMLMADYGDRLRGKGMDFLRRITEAARRMDLLITDALNYNKLVRSELPLVPVDVARLLQSLIESYPEFQAPWAEIRLDGGFPPVLGNEAGLTQCFSNLLDNAVKFAKPGKLPEVRIWAERRDSVVRVWFEDNGIGISKENQGRIFAIFQRMHPGHEGTGIGLALVRKAAERMGGKVGVESEEGKGSLFWLDLKPAL